MSELPARLPVYDPSDWYWVVGGDTSQAWSSARRGFVAASDPAYLAWLVGGRVATRIGSQVELDAVLVAAGVHLPPLVAHAKQVAQARIIAASGTVDINSCIIKQLNALMRATELANKGAAKWSPAEASEAAALQALADRIKAIRATSNAVEQAIAAGTIADAAAIDRAVWP